MNTHCLFRHILIFLCAATIVMLTGCKSSRTATSHTAKKSQTLTHLSKNELSGHHPVTARLLSEADKWIGTPYKFAGTDRNGVDCSGFTLNVFKNALDIKLPRNSAAQFEWCTPVRRADLMAGDLVFFSTNSGKKINHVGLYVGDGRIIHASTSKRAVILASMDAKWFVDHYCGSGRVEPYYAMVGPKKKKKKERKSKKRAEPDIPDIPEVIQPELPLIAEKQAGQVAVQVPEVAQTVEVTTEITYVEEPVAVPEPPKVKTVSVKSSPASVKVAEQKNVRTVSPDEARRKVINTYKELPPDSVMTSFFE